MTLMIRVKTQRHRDGASWRLDEPRSCRVGAAEERWSARLWQSVTAGLQMCCRGKVSALELPSEEWHRPWPEPSSPSAHINVHSHVWCNLNTHSCTRSVCYWTFLHFLCIIELIYYAFNFNYCIIELPLHWVFFSCEKDSNQMTKSWPNMQYQWFRMWPFTTTDIKGMHKSLCNYCIKI